LALAFSTALASGATRGIPLEKLDISASQGPGVKVKPVLVGEIKEVQVDLVSIVGPARHIEPASAQKAVVWVILDGKTRMKTGGSSYDVEGETIARAPQGWQWQLDVAQGSTLQAIRIRRGLTPGDLEELKKYPQNNAAAHVKKFSECTPYGEAIKSPKTISRTLLPENFVPRMAMGTVETSGPDAVGAHRHPMLEQIFLGLKGNDITVSADDDRANLTGFAILHIPLGSNHGAQVAEGKKLHYVWMDFFMAKEGQEWLKMHTPLDKK
jgi:quercetin dioxygenase-like cupin family protein/mannose-6-phosphate isomerase-like protein (cupin superfamily)